MGTITPSVTSVINATSKGVDPSHTLRPENYYQFIDKEGVIDTWLLVSTPYPVLCTIVVYLVLVLKLGPRYMRDREPFELKRLMMLYNLFQVGYNIWMLHLFHLSAWHYTCSKIIDLLDTCIMVLRKKQSHITYLHLYHHVAMVFFTWFSMKYIRAQQATVPIILNNLVHVVMYAYYFLAGLGPEVQRYLWWKRYLTKLQLTQFALIIVYLAYLYCNSCDVSQAFNVIWISNVSVIAAFFVNFYIQTYILRPRKTLSKCQ